MPRPDDSHVSYGLKLQSSPKVKRSIPSHKRYHIEITILQAVRWGYSLRAAAAVGGIHRATLYRWLASDSIFAERFGFAWKTRGRPPNIPSVGESSFQGIPATNGKRHQRRSAIWSAPDQQEITAMIFTHR